MAMDIHIALIRKYTVNKSVLCLVTQYAAKRDGAPFLSNEVGV